MDTGASENGVISKRGRGGSRVAGRARTTGKQATARPSEAAQLPQQALGLDSETIQVHRSTLLAEKQLELDQTIDKHDDLVRELFQMMHFRNMLLYDAAVAKRDDSPVFKEFKANYDLMDNTAPIAGPSRRTRGQANERRQNLKSNAVLPPPPAISSKRTSKKVDHHPELENILSSVRKYKGKGKEKEAPPHPLTDRVESASVDESTTFMRRDQKLVASVPENGPTTYRKLNGKALTASLKLPAPVPIDGLEETENPLQSRSASVDCANLPSTITDSISTYRVPPPKTTRNTRVTSLKRPAPVPIDVLEETEKSIPGQPFAPDHDPPPPISTPVPPDQSISANISRRSGRLREQLPPPTPKTKEIRPPLSENNLPDVTASPIFKVKRIKLIVRRPPPALSDPRQRPPPSKFNNSLPQFLSSYISIDELQPTVDPDVLKEKAKSDAAIYEKIEQFRLAGRFIPNTEVLFGTTPPDTPYTPPKRTSRDLWDGVVEAVIAHGKARPKKPLGRTVSAQIASRVQAHFASKESRRTKARDVEERRLRNLAKSTMKLVIGEWKKAVFYIREKKRLEQEEEERRVGRAHLDLILDQSGQLLETQHDDLTRGDMSRSRSGSIGDFDDDEEEDETDEEEDDDAGTSQPDSAVHSGEEGDSDDEDEGEADEEGTALLLGIGVPKPRPPPSEISTPASIPSELPAEVDEATPAPTPSGFGTALDALMMYSDSDSDGDLDADLTYPVPSDNNQPPVHLVASPDEQEGSTHHDDARPALDDPMDVDQHPDGANNVARSRSQSREVRFADDEVEVSPEDDAVHSEGGVGNDSFDVPIQNLEDLGDTDNIFSEQDDGMQEDAEDKDPEGPAELEEADDLESQIPEYLKPYAVAPVEWDPEAKVTPPLLLRGVLRPYQQSGLEWLASLHVNKLNGILADEMGLGKTIQTISLLAHLACDRGIWGPHLIIVPTSVLLNWEMEFKKFMPGFKVLSYHGSTKRRKELRQGWNDKHHFNVCITSYTLASRDAHIFKRKAWYYMILDEAHMIKNFKSQRWNILLMFRSYRRLLLTGTPLQNNLTELWALLQFLMSGANFANLKEFGDWFSNPLEKAIEMGNTMDEDTMQTVSKLHTVLRPYLLRRLKRDVEKELPSKFEHLTLCPLSKRQRFLYDEFMERAQTRDALESGVYQKIANILMQLRKVCNHPDLFEVRPIITSFAMTRSAIADFEIKELLVRRRFLADEDESVNLSVIGLNFIDRQNVPLLSAIATRQLDATSKLPNFTETLGEAPPKDTRTVAGYRRYAAHVRKAQRLEHWAHVGYLNKMRCSWQPVIWPETLAVVEHIVRPIVPFALLDRGRGHLERVDRVHRAVKSYAERAAEMAPLVNVFACVTPAVVARDMPRLALGAHAEAVVARAPAGFDAILHPASVKLQIAFPDPALLQWDCGKLQRLAELLREKKAGGHRVLIFTQMTRILDILEIFLNFHGYLYLRLDGATKIEDRQYITERFNADNRVFCFIASSRSGGVGINLTGADTVVFYDSDFNPQMDRQCEDRAHRIGQIRDVHIYRFVSQHSVEEAMLLKANQKRSLDDLVIQKGAFDWRALLSDDAAGGGVGSALTRALGDCEDDEDRHAAAVAAREEFSLVGLDEADFADGEGGGGAGGAATGGGGAAGGTGAGAAPGDAADAGDGEEEEDAGGTTTEYMLKLISEDYDSFRDWRL